MIRRTLFACALIAIVVVGAGCDDDACSPTDMCFLAEAEFSEEIPITTQTRLDLTGINGNVDVEADPGADRIAVGATRSVRSDSEADAEARLADLEVVIVVEETKVTIRTEQPEDTEGRTYAVDYRVTYPPDLLADVLTVNGNVEADGARARTVLITVNGNIDAFDMRGDVALTTVNGNIRADATLSGEDHVNLGATNGNLSLTVPVETAAQVSAGVANGAIVVRDLTWNELVRTDTSLTGRLGSGGGSIILNTVNGTITLRGR